MLLLLWIAALNYRPPQPYIPQVDDAEPRDVKRKDDDWLILHVTGHKWI